MIKKRLLSCPFQNFSFLNSLLGKRINLPPSDSVSFYKTLFFIRAVAYIRNDVVSERLHPLFKLPLCVQLIKSSAPTRLSGRKAINSFAFDVNGIIQLLPAFPRLYTDKSYSEPFTFRFHIINDIMYKRIIYIQLKVNNAVQRILLKIMQNKIEHIQTVLSA